MKTQIYRERDARERQLVVPTPCRTQLSSMHTDHKLTLSLSHIHTRTHTHTHTHTHRHTTSHIFSPSPTLICECGNKEGKMYFAADTSANS